MCDGWHTDFAACFAAAPRPLAPWMCAETDTEGTRNSTTVPSGYARTAVDRATSPTLSEISNHPAVEACLWSRDCMRPFARSRCLTIKIWLLTAGGWQLTAGPEVYTPVVQWPKAQNHSISQSMLNPTNKGDRNTAIAQLRQPSAAFK